MKSTATPYSVLDTASGDLVLRVCGSTRHGQILRLRSAKCTIGSGPRCTLRLRARGVRPIHCLIVRGSDGTVIRRWSPDTRLNGLAFTDAELVDGDRLGIGAIELEVLDAGRLSPPDPSESRQPPLEQPPSPQLPSPSRSDRRRIDQLTARLRLVNRQGRQRARRLLEKLRSANGEVARLRQLEAERPELKTQLDAQTEAINARRNDLDLQREAFERERRGWNAKLGEAEEQLRRRGEQLDADRAELEAQREDLQRRRRQWEVEHAAIASPQEQEEPTADSELQQSEPREVPGEEPTAGSELRQSQPREAPSEKPIDTTDVFRRLGSWGLSSEEEQRQECSAEPELQPSESPTADHPSLPSQPAEGGEEESIEDYMSRLMDRVHAIRGDAEREDYRQEESQSEQPVEPESQPEQPVEPESQPEQPVEPESQPEQPVEPESQDAAEAPQFEEPPVPKSVAPPRKPAEMAPRAVAPEKRVNLSAMRDLANLSAHSAIDRHAQRQARLASWGKLLIVAVGVGASTALLWIWWTTETSEVTFYAAMVSLLVALLWAVQSAGLAGRKMLCKSGRPEEKSGEDWTGGEGKASSQGQEAQGQEVLYSDRSNHLLEDSTAAVEHELKALIDAWPQR